MPTLAAARRAGVAYLLVQVRVEEALACRSENIATLFSLAWQVYLEFQAAVPLAERCTKDWWYPTTAWQEHLHILGSDRVSIARTVHAHGANWPESYRGIMDALGIVAISTLQQAAGRQFLGPIDFGNS